ncbi:MAG: metallophosphoesterase [Candidatus Zixiibacteriota bacterium]
MRNLFPVAVAVFLILLFGITQLLFLRFLNREWWRRRWIKMSAWALPTAGMLFVILWGVGEYHANNWLSYPGATGAILSFVLQLSLILSLPVSGSLHLINSLMDRLARRRSVFHERKVDHHRRRFLRAGAAAIPLASLSMGAGGMAAAVTGAKVYKKTIAMADLPVSLEGLRILHLSDSHLRLHVTLDDLAEVLDKASGFQPHLTVLTGDIADNLRMLPDALRMVEQFASPLGAFACLGNHEYFRGITQVRQIFDRSTVPLLVNEGVRLSQRGQPLYIAGIDDPRFLGAKDYDFFRSCTDAALKDRTIDDFVVLMSHRPDALDYSADTGVQLTLAGHTHGGQVGDMNRSLFESVWPDRYLWGHYRRKNSHLYTSSGVGHWFPFRLGCPAEAPVIELVRG